MFPHLFSVLGPTYSYITYKYKDIVSTLSFTFEGWRGYTAKEAPKGSSWVTEESSDRSVTESERVLPLSLLSSTLGLIILLQASKSNKSNGNLSAWKILLSSSVKEGKGVWEKEFEKGPSGTECDP